MLNMEVLRRILSIQSKLGHCWDIFVAALLNAVGCNVQSVYPEISNAVSLVMKQYQFCGRIHQTAT